jgi:hypothetical protein
MESESSFEETSSLWKFHELLDLRENVSIAGNVVNLFMMNSIGLFKPVMDKGLLLMEYERLITGLVTSDDVSSQE